jgi:hypothetical protein
MSGSSSVVVAGASAAGLSVAETVRHKGFDGRITLLGEENDLPYNGPPLSKKILSGAWSEKRVWLRDQQKIDDLNLDLRLGAHGVGVDPMSRTGWLADGSAIDYGELVIATGGCPRRLPGTDGVAGVHVLRTLDDARALRAQNILGEGKPFAPVPNIWTSTTARSRSSVRRATRRCSTSSRAAAPSANLWPCMGATTWSAPRSASTWPGPRAAPGPSSPHRPHGTPQSLRKVSRHDRI